MWAIISEFRNTSKSYNFSYLMEKQKHYVHLLWCGDWYFLVFADSGVSLFDAFFHKINFEWYKELVCLHIVVFMSVFIRTVVA